MGRKKRKVVVDDEPAGEEAVVEAKQATEKEEETKEKTKPGSSSYAVTSHSGEIIQEDIYVSDGTESGEEDAEGNKIEVVLVGSRMGMMRRGLHHPMVQPKRQWSRPAAEEETAATELTPEQKRQLEEEELAKLDPAERAARLLQEKQRKLEEAKELARKRESEENAGRDSMLFSKRTAFDIRFDQIEDKPWLRGNGDVSDFFNYGLTEEEWLEYSQQQLLIRQELIDARRQKRKPDPTLVPVTPREPSTQAKDSQGGTLDSKDNNISSGDGDGNQPNEQIGPDRPENVVGRKDMSSTPTKDDAPDNDVPVGVGGAWGAGALPGSMLCQLIEEQGEEGPKTQSDSIKQEEPNFDDSRLSYENDSSDYQRNDSRGGSVKREDRHGDYDAQDMSYADGGRGHSYSGDSHGEDGHGGSRSRRQPDKYHDNGNYRDNYYQQSYGHQDSGNPHDNYHQQTYSSQQYGGSYGHQQHDGGYGHQQQDSGYGHQQHHDGGYRRDQRGYDRYGGRGGRGGRGMSNGRGDYHNSRKRSWDNDSRRRR